MNVLYILISCLMTCNHIKFGSSSGAYHKGDGKVFKEYLAARQVYTYRSYRDMQIYHFNVPFHTFKSVFNLTSNHTDGCEPHNITVYLQTGSFPAVSPDGAKFPSVSWTERSPLYHSTLLSDLRPVILSVDAPESGDWFLVAFVYDDSKRITQAGIFPTCFSWLQVEATYYQFEEPIESINIHILPFDEEVSVAHFEKKNMSSSSLFRFWVPEHVWLGEILIINCNDFSKNSTIEDIEEDNASLERACPLSLSLRPQALPLSNSRYMIETNCSDFGSTTDCILSFDPYVSSWHYLRLEVFNKVPISFDISVLLRVCNCKSRKCGIDTYDVNTIEVEKADISIDNSTLLSSSTGSSMRNNHSFLFEDQAVENLLMNTSLTSLGTGFDSSLDVLEIKSGHFNISEDSSFIPPYVSSANSSSRSFLWNETRCWPSYVLSRKSFSENFMFEFDINPTELNGSTPFIVNLTNSAPTILFFRVNPVSDVGGSLSVDFTISPFVNVTAHNYSLLGCLSLGIRPRLLLTSLGKVICSKGHQRSVNTSTSGWVSSSILVPYPEPGPWFLLLYPSCFVQDLDGQVREIPCETNYTPIIFSVSSASCVSSRCGKFGHCFQYISGGFIFSTCVCNVGYRGYACSDGSKAIPKSKLLLSTLFLCLSNLFFMPAIALSLYRRFYTEALVYTFTMFFSTPASNI